MPQTTRHSHDSKILFPYLVENAQPVKFFTYRRLHDSVDTTTTIPVFRKRVQHINFHTSARTSETLRHGQRLRHSQREDHRSTTNMQNELLCWRRLIAVCCCCFVVCQPTKIPLHEIFIVTAANICVTDEFSDESLR